MDRSQSEDHIAFGPATPWERGTFGQLPRRGESAPSVPVTERAKPIRSVSVKATRPPKRSVTPLSNVSRYPGTPPPEDSIRQHRAQGSLSAQGSPRPYETPFMIPAAMTSAPSPPPCYTKALPSTPPESLHTKSSASTDKSFSPSSKQLVTVLPGTMAARTGRSKSAARQRSERRKKKPTKVNQWKVVFRQIFTRSPVDETQLEKIEGRHWADE